MSPNREPKWLSKEPVLSADAEFQQALRNDPFVGEVAAAALTNFIKATEVARTTGRKPATTEEVTERIVARIAQARDAAVNAPDPVHAQIFGAQLKGWEPAVRSLQSQPAPQQAPTPTAKKRMSGGKA